MQNKANLQRFKRVHSSSFVVSFKPKMLKISHNFTKIHINLQKPYEDSQFRQGISLFFEKTKPIRCLSFLRRQESKFVDASGFRIKCGMTIRNEGNYAKQTQFKKGSNDVNTLYIIFYEDAGRSGC